MNAVGARPALEKTPAPWPVWPQLRRWYVFSPLVVLAVIAVGYWVTHNAADAAQELAVDQYLSLHHLAWLTPVAVTIAVGLAPPAAVALTVAISVLVWWRRRNPWWGLSFGATVGCGWLFVGIVKLVIARPRPEPWTLADPLMPEINNASFPSGHTAFATALAVGLTLLVATSVHRRVRSTWPLVAALGAVAVVLVAASRIYMGVHYPSDVVCAMPTALAGCCFATGGWNTVVRKLPGGPVRKV